MTTAPKLPEGLEPVAWLTTWKKDRSRGTGSHLSRDEPEWRWEENHYEPLYTATQMREAILAATERAAKARQAVVPAEADEAFRLKKLTGQLVAPVGRGYAEGWKAGYEAALEATAIRGAAASTGRGEGGEGA